MDGNVSYGASASADGSKAKTPKGPDDPKKFLTEMRERLQQAYDADKDNRREAAIDLKFLAGDQWPDQIKREREQAGRPMLTINRLPQFVNQVTNDIRQADFSIKVAPVDDESDPALAKIYDGLIRQIQYQSAANQVYATAGESQVGCGIGWWRVCSEYADDEAFEQELRLKVIRNPLSVFCDPGAVEPDRSDAMWMIVTEIIPKADFERKYPDKSVSDVDSPTSSTDSLRWQQDDGVRIAEYWYRKPVEKTLVMTADGKSQYLEDAQTQIVPQNVLKTRKVNTYEVCQYIVSGSDILEGPMEWPSKWIPLVPALGTEIPQDKTVVRMGMIRNARDPQALYNYNRTASAEALALQPKNPWVATWDMIKQYVGFWNKANTANVPYLIFDPDPKAPGMKPYREPPPALSPAFANEAMIADQDMKATTGIYDASLGNQSNETSGVAIGRREKQGDTANYHYSDKLQMALWHTGRILIDVIPKFYDTERIVRLLGEDDTEEIVKVNQQVMSEGGVPVVLNDLSTARFDVRVKIGPSYSTKREEAAQFVTEFMRVDPSAAPLVRDILAKNSDMSGADEMAKRFKNVLEGKPPLFDPENPETQQPPPQPPDPEILKLEHQKQMDEQKLASDNARAEQQMSLEREKAMLQAEIERFKAQAQVELEQFKAQAQLQLQRETAHQDMEIKKSQAVHSAALAEKSAEAKAKANGNGADKPN